MILTSVKFEISPLEIPNLKEFLKKHNAQKVQIGGEENADFLTDYQEEMIEKGRESIKKGDFVENEEVSKMARQWLQSKM